MNMHRRQFAKITFIGCTSAISGCLSSSHVGDLTDFANSGFGFSPEGEKVGQGDFGIKTFAMSYTCMLNYNLRIVSSSEGYADSGPVDVQIIPRNGDNNAVTLIKGSSPEPIDTVSRFDIQEEIEVTGRLSPGHYIFAVINRGEIPIRIEGTGELTRTEYNEENCKQLDSDGINSILLNYVNINSREHLEFHFKISNPQSNWYTWKIKALTKTKQTSIRSEVEAECGAHFCGDWMIDEDKELGDFPFKNLKIEVEAIGSNDKYNMEEWLQVS
jgi:hypothetical protein